MSTFCGRFSDERFNNVCIDNFLPENHCCTAFFLSHFHSDHLRGIYDASFHALFQKKSTMFYCHELTRKFILACSEIKIPPHRIKSLDKEGTEVEIEEDVLIKVTWFSAGHCPGSIMLMFEGFGQRVIYTGDIRLSQSDLSSMDALHYKGEPLPLDTLYLDTTFAYDEFMTFPSRRKSFSDMMKHVDECFAHNQENRICILPSACIGFEFLMVEFYRAFNRKIHVSHKAYEKFLCHIPHIQHVISTDQENTKIHFCCMGGCENCYRTSIHRSNLLLIKPSALYFKQSVLKEHGPVTFDRGILRVCYSSHSSCEELIELVRYLKPKEIYPCVVPPGNPNEFFINFLKLCSLKEFNDKPESLNTNEESNEASSSEPPKHEFNLNELVGLSEPEIFVRVVSNYLSRPTEIPLVNTCHRDVMCSLDLETPT